MEDIKKDSDWLGTIIYASNKIDSDLSAKEFVKDMGGECKTVEDLTKAYRACSVFNNPYLLDALLSQPGIGRIPSNGNLIKQEAYAGRLELAKVLLKHGYPAPESIKLFSISNNINWKMDRLEFLINIGTKIELTTEEKDCLKCILEAVE